MRKISMKFMAAGMAALMAVAMVGCTTTTKITEEESTSVGMANPIKEVTEDEMIEITGIDLPAPEGATDVSYSVIEGDKKIAQMDFTLDGDKMYLRACPTSLMSVTGTDPEAEIEDLMALTTESDISGLSYEWTIGETQVMSNGTDAFVNISDDGAGFIAWVDAVPGILYNLCMKEGATDVKLLATADRIFVPVQGEVDGDNIQITVDYENLLKEIYETKAGSAGSSERVEAAGKSLCTFVANYGEDITLQSMEALSADKLASMKESYGDDFVGNFKECFDAVVEAAKSSNPDMETDVAFEQVVNSINNTLDAM